jgi:hypothetical protein
MSVPAGSFTGYPVKLALTGRHSNLEAADSWG